MLPIHDAFDQKLIKELTNHDYSGQKLIEDVEEMLHHDHSRQELIENDLHSLKQIDDDLNSQKPIDIDLYSTGIIKEY